MWFYFDTLDELRPKGSYDRLEEIIRYAKKFDIVKQRGSMFDLVNPVTGEVQTFKGSTALAQHIRDTESDRLWIEEAVMRAVTEFNAGEKQELAGTERNDEEARDESSEEGWSEETSSVGSDTVGEGRPKKSRVPVSAQADKTGNEVALS